MNHDEIRKYIVLLIALGLLITGIVLLTTNLPSEGSIDITTPLLSGKITSGNVGILIIFLSIIVISLALKPKKHSDNTSTNEIISKQSKLIYRLVAVIFGWIIIAVFIYLAFYFTEQKNTLSSVFTIFGAYGGIGMVIATVAFIVKAFSDD